MSDKPVTPDLQDNEFEITMHCPVGECPAIITSAYDNEAKTIIKEVRKAMKSRIKQAHSRGEHIARAK